MIETRSPACEANEPPSRRLDEDASLLILEINAFNKCDSMQVNIYGPNTDTPKFYWSISDHLYGGIFRTGTFFWKKFCLAHEIICRAHEIISRAHEI